MNHTSSELPLFPLQVVLLPGLTLPLHVYETRYKTLMNECAASRKQFGINLVLGGRVHRIGCTATLEEILRRYPDGRLDVKVRGGRRFRFTEEFSADETPYFVGKVIYLDDEPDSSDPEIRSRARSLLQQVLSRVYKGKEKPMFIFEEGRDLSYQLAEYSGLDFTQRQKLLECPNEQQRLENLIMHYSEILDKFRLTDGHTGFLDVEDFRWN